MIKSPEIIRNPSKTGDFMQPKNLSAQEAQGDLFRSRLDQILNNKHPLFQLTRQIDWSFFDCEFGKLFVEDFGRPGLPTRLIVGLHYLKHAFNESEESVVTFPGEPLPAVLLWIRILPARVPPESLLPGSMAETSGAGQDGEAAC